MTASIKKLGFAWRLELRFDDRKTINYNKLFNSSIINTSIELPVGRHLLVIYYLIHYKISIPY